MPFELKKDPKKWIVMGTGEGWQLAPKQSSSMICVLNDLLYQDKYGVEYDYLVSMDQLDEKPQVRSGQQNLGDVIARINASGKPFIAPYRYEEIPLSRPFPMEKYVKTFGAPYFLNTISYQIAFALLEGAEEIDIYGVNQASSSEFFFEKAACEYVLGIAIGKGVKVTIHGEKSELLTTKTRFGGSMLYGYNTTWPSIQRDQEKYGEAVIKKLLKPSKPVSRTVRTI